MGTGKKHSQKFKAQAVRISQQAGTTVTQAAREVGVEPAILKKWRREMASVKPKARNGQRIPHENELQQLRQELRRVTWELDFLKEAAAFLAKTSRQAIK